MKYSDLLAAWLKELGYTHCFSVAGGNIMHLMESCSRAFTLIPVIHEVAAGIAVEYFNEVHASKKAFALVTTGPGLTNTITAIAGGYLESRELLVIGGQVKVADLSRGHLRQRGFQEIDGVTLCKSITVQSTQLDEVVDRAEFARRVSCAPGLRKGSIFLEIPLDIQARTVDREALDTKVAVASAVAPEPGVTAEIAAALRNAERPLLLLGAGVSRETAWSLDAALERSGIPLMTSWTGADRVSSRHKLYFGRPNHFGQRAANILIQQADLVVALGTRLGIQLTGYNWWEFVPRGKIIQIDLDGAELSKGHPKIERGVVADANIVLRGLTGMDVGEHGEWVDFCESVRGMLPVVENNNQTRPGYISPYAFIDRLSALCTAEDVFIPCSSGSAFTVTFQTFRQQFRHTMVTSKGLASMGYGLSGAIGAAFAAEGRRTILVEGDGGFTQNLQELGTVAANRLNLKIFLFDDDGYASIRMTQSSYFGGRYVGCDTATGLGMPNWNLLFAAYGIPLQEIRVGFETTVSFQSAFDAIGPAAFLVKIDPKQTYHPRIASRVTADGSMESNPLHLMSPPLDEETAARVFKYL